MASERISIEQMKVSGRARGKRKKGRDVLTARPAKEKRKEKIER